jgi:hypothetical protein
MNLPDYLDGAVDLHVHSYPDIEPRRYDDIDLAREAARAGMGAILIKSHQASTVERAYLVSRVVSGIDVYGGIVLNETVGGLNPSAARLAIQLGAKQVWMPTRSAANDRRQHGQRGGITILDSEGRLCLEAREILALVAKAGCALGTGHLSPEEVFVLAEAAHAARVPKLLITHPEWSVTHYSIAQQKQLARYGNVMFERCFVSTTHRCGFTPLSVIERAIATLGVESTVLSTDLGQPDTPAPVEGLRLFTAQLRACGFSADQIYSMTNTNPRSVLTAADGLRASAAHAVQE